MRYAKTLMVMVTLLLVILWGLQVDAAGKRQRIAAPVPQTGQTVLVADGDDGDLQAGVTWPVPRFTDRGDGTVRDNLTGLFWLKDANRVWSFPDGTVQVETISLETKTGDAASGRRIETRILVKQQNHWLGYSYLWNDEQTDARLVGSGGTDLQLAIADQAAPGGLRQQIWHVPSRAECMVCHSRAAGFVLGLNTPQMNREHDYSGIRDNQLRTWNHIGMFRQPLKKSPAEYEALPNPYDGQGDIDARARAWLHVNCSVCHVADGVNQPSAVTLLQNVKNRVDVYYT